MLQLQAFWSRSSSSLFTTRARTSELQTAGRIVAAEEGGEEKRGGEVREETEKRLELETKRAWRGGNFVGGGEGEVRAR